MDIPNRFRPELVAAAMVSGRVHSAGRMVSDTRMVLSAWMVLSHMPALPVRAQSTLLNHSERSRLLPDSEHTRMNVRVYSQIPDQHQC